MSETLTDEELTDVAASAHSPRERGMATELLAARKKLAELEAARPIRYAESHGQTLKEMQEAIQKTELYAHGDARLVWVNEGDFWIANICRCEGATLPSIPKGD